MGGPLAPSVISVKAESAAWPVGHAVRRNVYASPGGRVFGARASEKMTPAAADAAGKLALSGVSAPGKAPTALATATGTESLTRTTVQLPVTPQVEAGAAVDAAMAAEMVTAASALKRVILVAEATDGAPAAATATATVAESSRRLSTLRTTTSNRYGTPGVNVFCHMRGTWRGT